jgi:hypothetical protein
MTASYTFDVFSSLDGYGAASANWSGYWGKQGPELLERRLALYSTEQRMVFGANTHREFSQMLADSTEESEVRDPIFEDALDFDLELLEHRTLDGRTQELIYRPTLH